MKRVPLIFPIVLSLLLVTGCDFISGIFQTGMSVGVFVAIVIVILVIFIVRTLRRR